MCCPPSTLRSTFPRAATMPLTVVDVVPAARQVDEDGQVTLRSRPVPAGTVDSVQLCPPSAVIATAPCP